MPDKHAMLSASSAARWIACPPSARAEHGVPDRGSSFAQEGTLAHAWGEYFLKKKYHPGTEEEPKNPMDGEMKEAVQFYVDAVEEAYETQKTKGTHPYISIEQRLDFHLWVPDGFGTGDTVIVDDETIEIMDLKYGKGVMVSAKDNPQLRLYALGGYYAFYDVYPFKTVNMTIVQPRLGNVDSDSITVDDLKHWGHAVHQKAMLAWNGDGGRHAGPHCKFCKVRETCAVLAHYLLDPLHGKQAKKLSDQEVADIILRAGDIRKYLTDISDYALGQALNNGKVWPGLKVVEGRSVRKIIDEAKAAEVLKESGYTDIYKPQALKTITDLTKLCGKKKFDSIMAGAGVIEKPKGKPTLVPASDRRPEYESNDFDDSLI